MDGTATDLEAISVASAPRTAAIMAHLREQRATFRDLAARLKMSNDGLTRGLLALERHGLIRGELSGSPDGSYSFYTMTERGKNMYNLVLDALAGVRGIRPAPVSDHFVVERNAFRRMLDKVGIDEFMRVFEKYAVVMTEYDYIDVKNLADEDNDAVLEGFLDDEERVKVMSVYDEIERSTGMEFHLRRAKKLPIEAARVVATAVDQKASIITDDIKMRNAALALGIRVVGSSDVLAHDKSTDLREVFPALSAAAGNPALCKPIPEIDAALGKRSLYASSTNKENAETLDEFVETVSPSTSKYASLAILGRLNKITDDAYCAKVSYEVFKIIGQLRERRYQRDVQDCLEPIEPLLTKLDQIFGRFSQEGVAMSIPVRNSYEIAHAESGIFNEIGEKNEEVQDRFLSATLSLDTPAHSGLTRTLLEISSSMQDARGDKSAGLHTVRSLLAAKRNIERRLDWLICHMDKGLLSPPHAAHLRRNDVKTCQDTLVMLSCDAGGDGELATRINKSAEKFLADDRWKHRQAMSVIIEKSTAADLAHRLDAKYVPDANDIGKIIKLAGGGGTDILSPRSAASMIGTSIRMADYYLHAGNLLGLLKRTENGYQRTDYANNLERYSDDDQKNILAELIKNLPVIGMFFHYMSAKKKRKFTTKDIAIFLEENTNLAGSTAKRRATTLSSWMKTLEPAVMHRNGKFTIQTRSSQSLADYFDRIPPGGLR